MLHNTAQDWSNIFHGEIDFVLKKWKILKMWKNQKISIHFVSTNINYSQ